MRALLILVLASGCAGGSSDPDSVSGRFQGDARLIFTFPERPTDANRAECNGPIELDYDDGIGEGTIDCVFDGVMEGASGTAAVDSDLRAGQAGVGGVNASVTFDFVELPIVSNVDGNTAIGAAVIDEIVVGIYGAGSVAGGWNVPRR